MGGGTRWEREGNMIIKGEVKCYFCGFVSGELVGEAEAPARQGTFRPVAACANQPRRPDGRLRCCRCGGPVYAEDISVVRQERTTDSGHGADRSATGLRERSTSS